MLDQKNDRVAMVLVIGATIFPEDQEGNRIRMVVHYKKVTRGCFPRGYARQLISPSMLRALVKSDLVDRCENCWNDYWWEKALATKTPPKIAPGRNLNVTKPTREPTEPTIKPGDILQWLPPL